jgi:pimeloyl-ACP methyl ester carboxylesterase
MRKLLVSGALLAAIALVPPQLRPGPDPTQLPLPARRVEIGGAQWLNVLEAGSGAPVVLVHGLPSNLGDWASVPARLADAGLRVVAYDRAGYGLSSRPPPDPGRYTYASNASDLEALLDALALERVTLVGWSYGGGIAMRFATLHPERVERVVLLSSAGPAQPSGGAFSYFLSSPFLLEWVAGIPPLSRRVVADQVAQAFSGAEAVPAGWVERTRAMLALPGTLRTLAWEHARHREVPLEPERIGAPTLVICGTEDRDTPIFVSEDLARRIPGARLETIPGGSHMLPATHPDRLVDAIVAFVGEGKP